MSYSSVMKMKCLLVFLSLIFNLVSILDAAEHFIVGGSDAEDGEFPYQVSLRRNGTHHCGASIISKEWLLTAAHCIKKQNAEDFTVVAGSNQLNSSGDKYDVAKLIPHRMYGVPSKHANDIALIQLTTPIQMKPTVAKIKLPTADTPAGTEVVLSGWGETTTHGRIPNDLQMIKLLVISRTQCVAAYRNPGRVVLRSNICTLTKAGEGACKGDSGGPLVAGDELVGVVSWGIVCATGHPDVFTKVFSYLHWIKRHSNVTS